MYLQMIIILLLIFIAAAAYLGTAYFCGKKYDAEKKQALEEQKSEFQAEMKKQSDEIAEERGKYRMLVNETLEALVGAIDAKDEYTKGHSARVARYSEMLAEHMGFDARRQFDIYYKAILHDIGKLGMPDNILRKSSSLNEEELTVIHSHPVIGEKILSNIQSMPDITMGARWHHERWDGQGYPDGLKGEEIPFDARLIGVADSYDAMTSKRSYRDILPQNIVRKEIEKGRGTQFDPDIADAMLQIIDEDKDYVLHG